MKWVNTRVVYEWRDGELVEVAREGYWYDGAWALAMDTSPVWAAEDFRFYYDTGAAGSSAIGAQNASVNVEIGSKFRLRVNVAETANATLTNTGTWSLRYSVAGGAFNPVTSTSSVKYVTSDASEFVDGNTLTQALGGVTGSAAYQSTWSEQVEDGTSASRTWTDDDTELEFSLQLNGVTVGQSVTFRMLSPQGTEVTFTNVPTLTVVAVSVTLATTLATGAAQALTMTATGSTAVEGAAGTGAAGTAVLTVQGPKTSTMTAWLSLMGTPSREQFERGEQAVDSASLTGIAATASANVPTVTGVGSTDVSGAQSTGTAGDLTITATGSTVVTGVEGTGQPGDLATTQGVTQPIVGVQGDGAAGDLTITAAGSADPTGVEATGAADDIAAAPTTNVALTGVEGAGAADVPTVTGVGNVTPDGAEATGGAGDVLGVSGKQVTLDAVYGTGEANAPTVTGAGNVTLGGTDGTGATGDITGIAQTNVLPTGVAGTGAAGDPAITGAGNVTATGASAASRVGELTIQAGEGAALTGTEGTGAAGTLEAYLGIPNPLEASGTQSVATAGGISVVVAFRPRIRVTAVSPARRAITAHMADRRKTAA